MATEINEPTGINNYSQMEIGRYVLQERLGEGEYSSTFRGIHKNTQESVAIKVWPKPSADGKKLFEAEITAYKTLLGLPGFLQFMDSGENDNECFIVTELIAEGTLRNILRKYPKGMEIKDVVNLFAPIADAVDLMHEKHIIHRDLKPENILIRPISQGYKVFIADFGVVKFTNTSQQFQTESAAGTPWYIAPESLFGSLDTPQSKAVDIYALGVMLYEALEGRFPYEDINKVINNQPALFPSRTMQKAGQFVTGLLLKTIHNDPTQRPDSAKEVINGIRSATNSSLSEKQREEQRWIGRKVRNYKISEVLGVGKMGTTLRASDLQTNKQVVLKAFSHSVPKNEKAYEKEINSLEKLEVGHGVLKPHDIFDDEETSFIVTEFQSGGTLRNLLTRKPKYPTDDMMEIFTQIAEAIDYIHEKKIVHRDIKPENIVYSTHEGKITPFITDFGVSAILASTQASFSTHHIGTLRYMAPELRDEKNRGTKAVDIYAFGVMLYEALEGHAPFETPGGKHYPSAQGLTADKTLKELGINAKNILLQTLAVDADERPKTATEIMQQVRRLGQHEMFLNKRYGKYTIEKFIGRGTYGATYRSYITKGKKKFAFKVLSVQVPLMHEIEKLKKLDHHDGIASIIDGGSENGIHYVITDYFNGNSLRDELLSHRTGMSLDEVLKLFRPIAQAIDYLHDTGMVHGDIKPENVILCRKKNDANSFDPIITGFGISKIVGSVQQFHSSNNYNYIAPELWKEGEPSPASDTYAFGIMLYETLEGAPPFNAKSLADKMNQHLKVKPPHPKNLSQFRGKKAVNALLQSLSKNPELRQTNAQALITQLEDKTQDNTSTWLGGFTAPLMKNLNPLITASRKKIELSYGRLATGTILLMALFAFLFYRAGQSNSASTIHTPTPTDLPPTLTATINSPGITPSPAIPTLPTVIIPATSGLVECKPDGQYPPDETGWPNEYQSDRFISVEDLYFQYYGRKRDNLDLYALAYYNNRKALETGLYHVVDPRKLGIERGWKFFLPSPSWIAQYRDHPQPILVPANPGGANSTINFSGSSTLYALSRQLVECFRVAHPSYELQIEPSNTRSGLVDFCQGRAEIFSTSEEITSTMISASGCSDVEFLKFAVAKYAAVVFVSDGNPYTAELRTLTDNELIRLLFTARTWDEVRSGWSTESVTRYYPPVEGGEFEIVKNQLASGANVDIANIVRMEDIRSIAGEVAGDEYAIGFSGFADYQAQKSGLVAIPIDGILPNPDTIDVAAPIYPLTRTLYLYTGKTTFDRNPHLEYFINYYLAYELDFLEMLGYFYPEAEGLLVAPYFPRP